MRKIGMIDEYILEPFVQKPTALCCRVKKTNAYDFMLCTCYNQNWKSDMGNILNETTAHR